VRRLKLRERSLPHRSASSRAKRCGFCIAVMKRALDVLSEALVASKDVHATRVELWVSNVVVVL
jgi:hypothetical protein